MTAQLYIPVNETGMPPRLDSKSDVSKTEPPQRAPFLYGDSISTAGEYTRSTITSHPFDYELPDLPLTPIDERTGLPWCFAPNPDLPSVPKTGERNLERIAEWNHQFPKVEVLYGANPALEGLGRMALLNLRHQWVAYKDHHEHYNPNFIGPLQPATPGRLAATVVMGLAGYVPEYCLDFSGRRPRERWLKSEEREFLWKSDELKVACEGEVIQFLFEYVFQQDIDHIRENEMDEFLHTFDLSRRIFLGHCLAAKIIERAVEPFNGVYAAAHKQGLLRAPVNKDRAKQPPAHPRDLVKSKLTSGSRFGKVYNELHKKLGTYNRARKVQQGVAA